MSHKLITVQAYKVLDVYQSSKADPMLLVHASISGDLIQFVKAVEVNTISFAFLDL